MTEVDADWLDGVVRIYYREDEVRYVLGTIVDLDEQWIHVKRKVDSQHVAIRMAGVVKIEEELR